MTNGRGNFYNGFTPEERSIRGTAGEERLLSLLTRASFCIACGADSGPIDLHAEDYAPPQYFDVRWRIPLCFRCHMSVHCRLRYPAGFAAYCTEIRQGRRWPPLRNRALSVVIAENLAHPGTIRGPDKGDPKGVILSDGSEDQLWKVPVLDMIGQGLLSPPGRIPGNSTSPTTVTPINDLPTNTQSWRIEAVIEGVETEPWLPIVERRVKSHAWRERAPLALRLDHDGQVGSAIGRA